MVRGVRRERPAETGVHAKERVPNPRRESTYPGFGLKPAVTQKPSALNPGHRELEYNELADQQ